MANKQKLLLTIDGIINLFIGILLLLFPLGMAEFLGVPRTELDFYPTILGAVIFGIGIALFIERFGFSKKIRGLGLGGAIAINFCAALALFFWLISTPMNIPTMGYIILWTIVAIVFLVGIIEIFTKSWHY